MVVSWSSKEPADTSGPVHAHRHHRRQSEVALYEEKLWKGKRTHIEADEVAWSEKAGNGSHDSDGNRSRQPSPVGSDGWEDMHRGSRTESANSSQCSSSSRTQQSTTVDESRLLVLPYRGRGNVVDDVSHRRSDFSYAPEKRTSTDRRHSRRNDSQESQTAIRRQKAPMYESPSHRDSPRSPDRQDRRYRRADSRRNGVSFRVDGDALNSSQRGHSPDISVRSRRVDYDSRHQSREREHCQSRRSLSPRYSEKRGHRHVSHQHRDKTDKKKPASAWEVAARNALRAGTLALLDCHDEPGDWLGDKGTKVATAALRAAIVDTYMEERHPESVNGVRHVALRQAAEYAIANVLAKPILQLVADERRGWRRRDREIRR